MAGVATVLVPPLTNIGIYGATQWLTTDKALLQLSLSHKVDEKFWYSFFHEAGHILLHGKRDLFLEIKEDTQVTDKEEEANCFAVDLLTPSNRNGIKMGKRPKRSEELDQPYPFAVNRNP
jgi:hypothetical protein